MQTTLVLRFPFVKAVIAIVAIAIVVIASVSMASCSADSGDDLERGWHQPPADARPHVYWLWLNGYVNAAAARQELEAMKDAGFGGVLLFDMGARGDEAARPPAGPAFLSDAWLEQFRDAVSYARELGLQVDLSVISSWDMGGHWIEPTHASKGIYITESKARGGSPVELLLPFPDTPAAAPLGPDGKPAYWADVAVLALRDASRAPGHDIVLQLDPPAIHEIRGIVLDQGDAGDSAHSAGISPLREFSFAVSDHGTNDDDFREVLRDQLPQGAGPRRFPLPAGTAARYVRLRMLSAHHADRIRWSLGEFAVLNDAGLNLAGSHTADRTRSGAEMLRGSPGITPTRNWSLQNVHDGSANGASEIYATAGLPPLLIPDASQVETLTGLVGRDGWLRWSDAPEGEWTILRYVLMNTGERLKVPSPHSDGWTTDHFAAEATDVHMQYVIGRLQSAFSDLRESGLRNLYLASYEVTGPVWSPGFLDDFKRLRGYDMAPYLPAVFGARIGSEEATARFLFDYRKTLSDMLIHAYYKAARDAANAAGLGIKSEAGGPGLPIHNVPVDALLSNSVMDEIQGEFWPFRPHADHLWVVKETASAGHLYGKPRIHMEAFTSMDHWSEGPQDLKPSADRVFCEGGNHMVWHTWTHAPQEAGVPGWVYLAGTHVNQNVTWWTKIKPFVSYLSRASYLLQRGQFVGDVLYYYGDGGYKFVPPRKLQPGLGYGYDYDVINSDAILNRLSVRDGRFVLPDGTRYAVLVMPEGDQADLEVLTKLDALVQAGGTVIGPRPSCAHGLGNSIANDEAIRALGARMWGELDGTRITERSHGKGKVALGKTPRAVLSEMGIGQDVDAPETIDFIHRREGEAEIYFLRNTTSDAIRGTVRFRVSGKAPELWDAVTGEIRPALGARSVAGSAPEGTTLHEGIEVPLELDGYGSVFVVFRKKASAYPPTPEPAQDLPGALEIAGTWLVDYQDGPSNIPFAELDSWTRHADPEVRHFAGSGRYRISFDVPAGWRREGNAAAIDLGDLWNIAEVWLNGQPLGITWTKPFRLDASSALREGQNELAVEVTNTWQNRLIADAQLPRADRRTRTNATASSGVPFAKLKPIDSGLFGPVRLIASRR